MDWREGIEILRDRGWSAERLVRALLALVRDVPRPDGLSVGTVRALLPEAGDPREAEALAAVARAWLSPDEALLRERIGDLPRLDRS